MSYCYLWIKSLSNLFFLLPFVLLFVSCGKTENKTVDQEYSLMMMRFGLDHSYPEDNWNNVFTNIEKEPNCCDEVWFSTGFGYQPLEFHRKHAEIIKKAKQQLNKYHIRTSVQIQMTIGHGDYYDVSDSMVSAKNWIGWTGSSGVVDRHCSCPRQKGFLDYIGKLSQIYAETEPVTMWIDDDLRYINHRPASDNSLLGCWCDSCLAEFNRLNSSSWTRETLAERIKDDVLLLNKWNEFSTNSLLNVAKVIATEIHRISPKTRLGLQHSYDCHLTKYITAVLNELHNSTNLPVESRPGGSYYHDEKPSNAVIKSMYAARYMKKIGNPSYVCNWCPEITTRPRVYGSRSAQSIMIEGFTALAYGLTSLSYYITEGEREKQELYLRYLYKPISEGSEMIKNYAKECKGTIPVGYEADVDMERLYSFSISAIPVLPGIGKSLGKLNDKELKTDIYEQSSSVIQQCRQNLPSPAICSSPFVGIIIPRIDSSGFLRTIGVINTRIEQQELIRLRLDSVKCSDVKVFWHEMKKEPLSLPIEKDDKYFYVTIPEIEAWSAGFLSIKE